MVRERCYSIGSPNGYTYSMVLKGSTNLNVAIHSKHIGREVHAHIVRTYIEIDDVLYKASFCFNSHYTTLVDLCLKNGRVKWEKKECLI